MWRILSGQQFGVFLNQIVHFSTNSYIHINTHKKLNVSKQIYIAHNV